MAMIASLGRQTDAFGPENAYLYVLTAGIVSSTVKFLKRVERPDSLGHDNAVGLRAGGTRTKYGRFEEGKPTLFFRAGVRGPSPT
jgi:hypothetical protein